MCNKVVEEDSYQLGDFPDHLKTRDMCEKAVVDKAEPLGYVLITLSPKGGVERPLKMNHTA